MGVDCGKIYNGPGIGAFERDGGDVEYLPWKKKKKKKNFPYTEIAGDKVI